MNSNRQDPNLAQLVACAAKLEPLLDKIAFVGGCVTGLLVTDPASVPVRSTLDVDVIVEAASYAEFTVLDNACDNLDFVKPKSKALRFADGSTETCCLTSCRSIL
jgi:hypothetical protein